MARSQYIYLVRYKDDRTPIGAFTVKKEAQHWAQLRCAPYLAHPLNRLQLSRMRDGLGYLDKGEVDIPWENEHDFRAEYLQEPPECSGGSEVPETYTKAQTVRH